MGCLKNFFLLLSILLFFTTTIVYGQSSTTTEFDSNLFRRLLEQSCAPILTSKGTGRCETFTQCCVDQANKANCPKSIVQPPCKPGEDLRQKAPSTSCVCNGSAKSAGISINVWISLSLIASIAFYSFRRVNCN